MLSDKWAYNKSIKNTIIAFGTLFSNIELRRFDNTNTLIQTIKVPIQYSNRDRLIARSIEVADLEKDSLVGQKYPQMAFEMISLSYDTERKLNTVQKLYNCSADGKNSTLVPVPYNIGFELSILTISNDDALQIIEQILPYFTPTFTIKIVSSPGFPYTELPITLNNINFSDSYAGNYMSDTREIIYTLRFTAKANVFGVITNNNGAIIKSVTVNVSTVINSILPTATLSVTPVALTDLNNDNLINNIDTNLLTATDDFGFSSVWDENYV
jgi:hypothetical protein